MVYGGGVTAYSSLEGPFGASSAATASFSLASSLALIYSSAFFTFAIAFSSATLEASDSGTASSTTAGSAALVPSSVD